MAHRLSTLLGDGQRVVSLDDTYGLLSFVLLVQRRHSAGFKATMMTSQVCEVVLPTTRQPA
jgi:hypothetical protein